MIYFISNQQIIETDDIKQGSIKQMLEYCADKELLGLDIETTGFCPYTDRMLCVQIGNKYNQFVIDSAYHSVSSYKSLLEDVSKTFMGHNLKFDLRFMLHEKIIINNIYDTYIAEQILWNGYDYMRKSLDYVSERYTGEFLNKSIRSSIHREGLTHRVIRYAADDIRVLFDIKDKQIERANKWKLNKAIELNNLFVPVIAYLEYCGFKLDEKLWQDKIDNDNKEINITKNKLDKFIIDNNINKFVNKQLDLFNPELTTNINWNSSQQVVEFFNIIDVDTSTIDKDSGEIKKSVNSDLLKRQIDSCPIVEVYIRYRKLLKRVSTYGTKWFKFINPITGRIHTKFQQWMSTGRMSSGGKEKGSKIEWINAQNIPADKATRQCIIADEGNILINADYSSQEIKVFIDKCQDPALIKMIEDGLDDQHGYTAWLIFPEIKEKYPEISPEVLKLIKKEFPEQRTISKQANFAINYGGTGYTIAQNCNVPQEVGDRVYDQYFKSFKGVKKYFDTVYKLAKKRGFIQYNNITKSKYFIPKGLKDGKIKNNAYNYPIQGSSADMTKYAGILYWRSLIERNLVFTCKIAIICHDEYLIEVPQHLAEQEAKILKQCMEDAGKFFCKTIEIIAEPVITTYWHH